MQVPDEVLDLGLKPSEYYLLAILYRKADARGLVELTMEQLSEMTGSSRTTLWRDFTGLEAKGLVDTHRTKRNFGKFYKNKYQLVPCFNSEHVEVVETVNEDLSCFKSETSTADRLTVKSSSNTLVKNTSYSLRGVAANETRFKEIKLVNSWKDDDDLGGGFGLLDSDLEKKAAPKKVSKARPINRDRRSESEWTAQDVATEYGMMLYQLCKAQTGPVDSGKLRAILGSYRKRYNLTASVELDVMRRMFGDPGACAIIRQRPENGYKVYLSWLTNHVSTSRVTSEPEVDIKRREVYVYASDGTEFDNSMPGKLELAEYEASLKK